MPVFCLMPQNIVYLREFPAENPFAGDADLAIQQWLTPSSLFGALHVALHETFPQVQLAEHLHAWGLNGHYPNRNERNQRFGSLAIAGPFPCWRNQRFLNWFFPAPSDVYIEKYEPVTKTIPSGITPKDSSDIALNSENTGVGWWLPVDRLKGTSNLPEPLKYGLGYYGIPKRESHSYWWSKEAFEAYLIQKPPLAQQLRTSEQFYSIQHEENAKCRNRILSDCGRMCQVRFNEECGLSFSAYLPVEDGKEGLNKLFFGKGLLRYPARSNNAFRIFPQYETGLESLLPISAKNIQNRMKWVLLAPAIFPESGRVPGQKSVRHPGGWLPNWICPETGQVMLRVGTTQRKKSESRTEWRLRIRKEGEPYRCHLVAASITGMLEIRGWSQHKHTRLHEASALPGPKPVINAVPAGSVYYFEGPDASVLACALQWHGNQQKECIIQNRRSTLWGEKGFGIGVCGPWSPSSLFTPHNQTSL